MTSEFPADTALTAAGEKPHSSRKKSEKNFSVIPAASAPKMSDAMIRYGIIRCRVRSSSLGAPGEKEMESSQVSRCQPWFRGAAPSLTSPIVQ